MHLLVIEDERALCETIVRDLRRLAYSVDFCHDGEEALELLYNDEDKRAYLGQNALQKSAAFSAQTMARDYADVYMN